MTELASNKKSIFSWLPGRNAFLRFDKWLRLNYPFVWRTKVHYFFLFSLLLLNPLLYLIAHFFPVNITNFPGASELNLLALILMISGLLVLIYWIYKQARIPIGEQTFSFYLKNLGIYSLCIFFIYLNSIVFLRPIILKIANLVEDTEFATIYNYHANHNFWYCDPSLNSDKLEIHEDQIKKDLIRLDIIDSTTSISTRFSINSVDLCADQYACLAGREKSSTTAYNLGNIVKNKLTGLYEAKQFREGHISIYDRHFRWWNYLGLSFLLASLFTLFTYPSYAIKREWQPALLNNSKVNLRLRYANLIEYWDNYILTHYPVLWSSKFHTYLIHSIVFTIGVISFSSLALVFWEDKIFDTIDDIIAGNNGLLIIILLFIFMLVSSIYWGYFQVRNKYIPVKFHENLYLIVVYFFLIFLVPFLISTLITFLISDSDEGVFFYGLAMMFITIAAIPIVTWVYSSKFLSNRQSLYVGLFSVGVLIGSVGLYILMEDFEIDNFFTLLAFYAIMLSVFYFVSKTKRYTLLIYLSAFYMSLHSVLLVIFINAFGIADFLIDYTNPVFPVLFMILIIPLLALSFTPAIKILLKTKTAPRKA